MIPATALFLIACAISAAFAGKSEWLDADPDESGIPECRKCTFEFQKLELPEQNLWKEIVETIPFEDLKHKLLGKFNAISNYCSTFRLHPLFQGIAQGKRDKDWDDLSPAQRDLIKFYFLTKDYSDEEMTDALQDLYIKMASILSWREYELMLREDEEKDQAAKILNVPIPIIPPLTANLTAFKHYEL